MAKTGINLLPRSLFELRRQRQIKIDKTAIYTAFLPLVSVLIWFAFSLMNGFVNREITKVKTETISIDSQISSYQGFKDKRALLVLKTQKLEKVISDDINPEKYFDVVQEIITSSGLDITIQTYGRENEGSFYIEGSSGSVDSILRLTRLFRESGKFQHDLRLDSISTNTDEIDLAETYNFNLIFKLV